LQPIKHSPEVETFSTRRVAVVEGDREAAEMLHMFFRLMELECSLISPDSDVVSTIRREDPDAVILDLDLAGLRPLEIAGQIRPPVIFVTDRDLTTIDDLQAPVIRKPRDRFEELLRLFEMVLAMER
jgi:DNA-binding response OmpR family regulator